MNRFDAVTHLTFDCYGTLIDWETGILSVLEPWALSRGVKVEAASLLRSFVTHEARIEAGPWRSYRQVLGDVMAGIAADSGVVLAEPERSLLADSLPDWPPFADTVAALRRLKTRFRLVIVSNTDDALFAGTARRLEVPFDDIITAEQVRSYKPGEAHFQEALRRLRVPAGRILHMAQSLYHDHAPAKRLGWQTAHIDRPTRLSGTGLAPAASVTPDWQGKDLASLVTALGV